MTDETIVICSPWAQRRVPSIMVACRVCDRPLAMSKQVRRELPGAVAECAPCAKRTEGEDFQPMLTPSARAEVMARYGFDPGEHPGVSLRDIHGDEAQR